MNQKVFNSISSDDNLFDFESIVRMTMRDMQMDEDEQLTRVKAYMKKRYPKMMDKVLPVMAKAFIAREMNYHHFLEMMDALGCAISIVVTKPIVAGHPNELLAGTHPPVWDKRVYELDLHARWMNVLIANNIEYLGQLIWYSEDNILRLPNMGNAGMLRLKTAMKMHGLVFSTDTGDWKTPEQHLYIADDIKVLTFTKDQQDKLRAAGITTVGQVFEMSDPELLKIVKMTPKESYELYKLLESKGLVLRLKPSTN
jgi:DNA-directed RNA polymerase alpha subunit